MASTAHESRSVGVPRSANRAPAESATPESARLSIGTLIAACLAVCVAEVTIAMPTVLNGLFQEDFSTTGSQLAWITDASLLPVTVLALTFGVVGDLFGRKRLLVAGSLLLLVGAAVTASAGGIAVLWTGRAISGIGAAALFPTSLAMVASGTHTSRTRARGVTAWAASLAAGATLAPIIAGISATHDSWRAAFITLAILGLVAAVLALAAQESSSRQGRSLDWGGQITIAVGLFALLYAVIQGPTDGWGSGVVIGAFVIAAVLLAAFVVAEHRSRFPLLRLELFTNRAFTVSALVTIFGMFSFVATAYSTSIRLGPIQHQRPAISTLEFIALNAMPLVAAPLTSVLVERINPRWVLGIGLLLTGAGDLWESRLPITGSELGPLVGPMVLAGLGFAFTVTSISAVAVNTVPTHLAGMASGATSLLRDFGFTLGPAVISAVALSHAAGRFTQLLGGSSLPAGVKAAAGGLAAKAGPLAVNSVPPTAPPHAAAPLAVQALGSGYSLGLLITGIIALVGCVLAVTALPGARPEIVDVVAE